MKAVFSISGAFLLVGLMLAATPATAQVRVVNPSCWSTTEDYITEELTVPIQPQTAVTIKRFQGPQLKLFCVSFDESGPSCTGTTTVGTPQLCSRPVSSSSSAYSCEDLIQFQADPNAGITRGSINGPEMIWLVRWDGTQQPLSCYPKVVTARMLIFVEGKDPTSVAVLVILSIIVAFVVVLMAIAFYSFLANRYAQIDSAGATTIGGPGATFRGPQMQINANGGVLSHTRVLLPVKDGDAGLNDLRANKFGAMTNVDENMTTEQILMPTNPRTQRASPPRPGDGVKDGMFPSPGRRGRDGDFGDFDDGEEFYDESGYTSGEGGRRGRGGRGRGGRGWRGGRGGRRGGGFSPEQGGKKSKYGNGADFPTQHGVETAGGQGFEGFDSEGAPIPAGMDGRVKQVKYIPRWMQGSFGRGGMVPEPLDGTFPEDNDMTSPTGNRTNRGINSGVATMGVYSRMSPKRRQTPDRRGDGDFDQAGGRGGDSENRFGRSGGLKQRRVGGSALKDRSPNSNRQLGYNSDHDQHDSFRGGRGRRHPRQKLQNRLSQGYDENDQSDVEVDNFQRGKARLTSGQDIDPAGPSRDAMGRSGRGASGPRGGLDGSAPLPSRMDNASLERPGASAYRCNSCGFQLSGTTSDPPFCSVSGDRHY